MIICPVLFDRVCPDKQDSTAPKTLVSNMKLKHEKNNLTQSIIDFNSFSRRHSIGKKKTKEFVNTSIYKAVASFRSSRTING